MGIPFRQPTTVPVYVHNMFMYIACIVSSHNENRQN